MERKFESTLPFRTRRQSAACIRRPDVTDGKSKCRHPACCTEVRRLCFELSSKRRREHDDSTCGRRRYDDDRSRAL